MVISKSSWCGNITNFISKVQTPNLIWESCLDSSPCIFGFKFVIWTILDSTKLTFQIRSNVFNFIKLCNCNITPVWNLYLSNNFRKIDLRLIIDSMNSMRFITEWLYIRTFKSYSWETLFLAIRREATSLKHILHDFIKLIVDNRFFNMVRCQKFLIILILKFLIFT